MKMNKITKTFARNINKIKKSFFSLITAISAATIMTIPAFASAGKAGNLDPSEFLNVTETVVQLIVGGLGAFTALMGVIHYADGHSNDNPGSKSQGGKQLMAGIGIIVIAVVLVPVAFNMIAF